MEDRIWDSMDLKVVIYTCIYIYIYIYIYMCVCVCVCEWGWVYVYVYIYICTCITCMIDDCESPREMHGTIVISHSL